MSEPAVDSAEAPGPTDGVPRGDRPVVGERTRKAAQAVLALTASEVVAKVATFALMVGAFRLLGQAQFGAFSYALNLGLLLATLPSWGFDAWLIQQAAGRREIASDLYSTIVTLRAWLLVPLIGVGLWIGIADRNGSAALAFGLVIAATMLDTVTDAGRAAAGVVDGQIRVAAVLVLQRFATAVLGLTAIFAGAGLLGLSAAFLTGSVAAVVGMSVGLRGLGIRFRRAAVTRVGVRAAVTGSFVIGVDAVVSMALFRVDTLLLGLIKGDNAVGSYAAAYRLIETVLFVTWSVSRALFPTMAAAGEEVWRVRRGVDRGLAVTSFIFLPYAAVLLVRGGDVLTLLYGSTLGDGVAVLRWLSLAPLMFGLSYLLSYALLSVSRTRQVLLASLVAAVANLGANLALIPHFGAVGAAAVTTLSYALEAVVAFLYCIGHLDGRLRVVSAVSVPALAAVPVVGVLLLPFPVLVAVALAAPVYLVAWYALARALDPEQIAVMNSLRPGGSA